MVRIPFLVREERRFLALLATILILLLAGPILGEDRNPWFGQLVFTFVLVAGVYAACENRRILTVGVTLGVLALASSWIPFDTYSLLAIGLKYTFPILFLLFLCGAIFRKVLTARRITANMIYGALCVYLLLGISFAYACAMIDNAVWLTSDLDKTQYAYHISELHPHARSPEPGIEFDPALDRGDLNMFLYYSFTTMTTLGYGDIIPMHPTSRVFSSIMAIIGQLYLAVFVARLVGTQISHSILAEREAARQDE